MTPPPNSPSSPAPSRPKLPWPLLFQLGGLALAAGVIFFVTSRYPLMDWLACLQNSVESLGIWSGLVYPFAYAICNLLLLPGGVLSFGGGFFFGLWWGFALVLSGNLLGAAAAFTIGRKVGRQRLERFLQSSRRLQMLDRAIERHGWKIVVLSQLNPLAPSSLLNYLYGLTRVSLRQCLVWIALGQMPGLLLYVLLGTLGQFGVEMAHGTRQLSGHGSVFVVGGLIVTILTTWLLGRLARRIMAEVESGPVEQPDLAV